MSTETAMGWEIEPMRSGAGQHAADACATSSSATAANSGSSASASRHEAFFRFLLPLARTPSVEPRPRVAATSDSRPEFYDFDLFQTSRAGARARRPARWPS